MFAPDLNKEKDEDRSNFDAGGWSVRRILLRQNQMRPIIKQVA